MNKSELFINHYNHCLVSIFSEYADEKIQIIGHVVNIAFILIKDYINPESKKGIHYIIMVFVLLNWH